MKSRKILTAVSVMMGGLLAMGCAQSSQAQTVSSAAPKTEKTASVSVTQEPKMSKGEEYTKLRASTNWQGTKVYDNQGNDLTMETKDLLD